MLGLSRQARAPVLRVSSRYMYMYFTAAKLPSHASRQNSSSVTALNCALITAGRSVSHVGKLNLNSSRVTQVNSCACFRAYSTGKEVEKTPEAQTPGSESGSQTSSGGATFRSREPTSMERKIFVWTGKYKTVDEVPDLVSEAALMSAKSKFRIYVNLGMGAATLVAAIAMIIIGKSRSKRGESVSRLNIRRHPEMYGRMTAEEDAKK